MVSSAESDFVICRRKESARYGAARPSASRRSASRHAFAIVSRIARCNLPFLRGRVELEAIAWRDGLKRS